MKTFTPPEPPHSTNSLIHSHFNTTFSSMYAV